MPIVRRKGETDVRVTLRWEKYGRSRKFIFFDCWHVRYGLQSR